MVNFGRIVYFLPHTGNRFGDVEPRSEQDFIRLFESVASGFINAVAAKPFGVKAGTYGRTSGNPHIRRRVLHDARHTAYERQGPDFAELMDAGNTPDASSVLDYDVARQPRRVRHDDVVADNAIVTHMAIGHVVTVVADCRRMAGLFRKTSVDGNAFADNVAVAYSQPARAVIFGDSLRYPAKHSACVDMVVRANTGVGVHDDVRVKYCSVAYGGTRFDHAVWTYNDILS